MANLFFHLVRLFFMLLSCVIVLWCLALMLFYHERTGEKIFWWIAVISLMAYTYFVNTSRRIW
jgi:hypothetical protein